MFLAIISWVAVFAGFAGTWVAGKHRAGWLIGTFCCVLWLGYDIWYGIWAGAFASVVGTGLNLRNWRIQAGKRVTDESH